MAAGLGRFLPPKLQSRRQGAADGGPTSFEASLQIGADQPAATKSCRNRMTWLPVQTPAMARTFLLGVVALTALAWPAEVVAQGVKATVLSIGDGDTIRLRQAGKALTVRLACIDAPETAQGMLGSIAREALHGLVGSAPLELRVQTRDRYGRTVAEVFAGGVNVGLEMVRRGDVFVYRQYLSGCDASTYLAAEAQAERSRAGVWRWGNVERPWDFRKNR